MSLTRPFLQVMLVLALLAAFAAWSTSPPAEGQRDGQVLKMPDGGFIAWDAQKQLWFDPEAFWASFADRKRGKDWGSGSAFPPYADVNEHDTFLLELEEGPCLMYFFHTRWRRANDVWRWGPEFNAYGGCPHVFD